MKLVKDIISSKLHSINFFSHPHTACQPDFRFPIALQSKVKISHLSFCWAELTKTSSQSSQCRHPILTLTIPWHLSRPMRKVLVRCTLRLRLVSAWPRCFFSTDQLEEKEWNWDEFLRCFFSVKGLLKVSQNDPFEISSMFDHLIHKRGYDISVS